ncbi:hypothetical protein [Persicobacter psychrovividus]|uniref:Alpha-L-arabinofuranosidase n=1 Tax=Persicobacter psychrovividus TaxID=387638 RepID=A0ABN6L7J6_9BACT|nr:hypothetical protein PEPS_14560 [Persicobacter psychrovividus]
MKYKYLYFSSVAIIVGLIFAFGPSTIEEHQEIVPGKKRAINSDMIGVNANLVGEYAPEKNVEFIEAIQDLNVKTIRYPGGTIGNYWDWDLGWIDQDVPDNLMIKWVVTQGLRESKNRYTVEQFAELVHKTNSKPVFMLNMLSKDRAHALRNLRRAAKAGLEIEYVEMGNELYFDLPFPKKMYPSPEIYGDTCQAWIAAIKAEFPKAKCSVLGTTLERHKRQENWTNRVLAHCNNADAITYHKYGPSGLDGSKERLNITAGTEGSKDLSSATRHYPGGEMTVADWEKSLLQDPKAQTNMWVNAQKTASFYKKLHHDRELPLWITEFNMRDDHSITLHSWAHSLITSVFYLEFLNGPVEITSVHNLVGGLFGQIYTKGFNTGKPYELTAGGVATSLFSTAIEGKTTAIPMEVKDQVFLENDKGERFEGLQVYAFTNEANERSAILINFSANYKSLQKPDLFTGLNGTIYNQELAQNVVGWESLKSEKVLANHPNIELPPFSICILK